MKIYVDSEKTIGTDLYFLGSSDWVDFNDNTKVLGTKVTVGLPVLCEKIIVKIPKAIKKADFLEQKINFQNLNGTIYTRFGKTEVSWKADDIFIV